jgi:hypothetical protein
VTLDTYALDTLANVKDRLGVTDSDRDTDLESLINRVSREFARESGREFAPASASSNRTVAYRCGADHIILAPYDARTVTAVTIDPSGSYPKVLASGEWQLQPITNPDSVYQMLQLKKGITVASGSFDSVPATVTGTWGWTAVPKDVQGWFHEVVEALWKRDHAFFADADAQFEDAGIDNTRGFVLPFHVQVGLEGYQMPRSGVV